MNICERRSGTTRWRAGRGCGVVWSVACADAGEEEARVSVAEGAPLEVECRLRPEQAVQWRLDGAAPPADLRPAAEAPAADGRLVARLRAPHARPRRPLHVQRRRAPRRARRRAAAAGRRAGRRHRRYRRASALLLPACRARRRHDADPKEVLYDVRLNLTLSCTLPNDKNLPYVWTKNETNVEEVADLQGRYKLERGGAEFSVARTVEDDFGNYTCALRGAEGAEGAGAQRWLVSGRSFVKLPANANVVEGQKLKLQCKVIGKPYPRVVWRFNSTAVENSTDVRLALGERVTLRRSEQGAEDGELLLEATQRSDAGLFSCTAPRPGSPAPNEAATTLRVKDMYAALWPFLGICAEVFVLCAIILVYEKRRTKPDLDDSDTDNHDQ
ncbi:unnamed protein product, partial [Iphiclides podalirius]